MQHSKESFAPVVLYGPPGVGKSTLIALAAQRGYEAYDFEELGSSYEERKVAMLEVFKHLSSGFVLCGAADLHAEDFPVPTKSVLLLPDREVYAGRVQGRDYDYPHKGGQTPLEHYDRFVDRMDTYDLCIQDELSPASLLDQLVALF